ncbi:PREDICTED: nuclear hormone receptor FTZ-F1 [Ceratosolen solmsi marchali]|uniref:Nuclear hormone receptor FTZ-F1 n=1 Tax=Ceratosolen solmsi marchali TaxID=326594 RepID=A0AAJ7E105_9HYME|nr:PREDICTED: nuclear hormone receptor FTZ-F1 [Ceratosolen solmsi marchali]
MLLEMEQHSGLISLNMSPFHLSPQSSPQDAGSASQQSQQSHQTHQSHQSHQPHQYSPSTYGSCVQSPGSNLCHQQQSQLGQSSQGPTSSHSGPQQQQPTQQQTPGTMSGFEAVFFDGTSLEERCPMCGDKMSGYQYGLLSCESCKGFFKRNNSPCSSKKVYTCLFSPTGGGGPGGNSTGLEPNSYAGPTSGGGGSGTGGNTNGVGGNTSNGTNSTGNGSSNNSNNNSGGGNGSTGGNANGAASGVMCHPGLTGQVGVGVVTGSISGPSDFPDTKDVIEELCPVCGDKVSGYHYGLLTCESCKGFFKRTVQNKKVYTCVAERSCHIDKTQRKRCPFCRFQKCLEVGMKLEAVRADRMRGGRNKFGPMYKRDRARKLQMMRQRQLALQTIRGTLGDPANYPATVTPFLHIKQEIQIPQVSSLTSSPDSSPSPAAVAAGLVTTQATSVSGSGQHQMIAPSSQASLTSATSNSGHLGHGPGSASGIIDSAKLWPANSTTPSPKSFSGFEQHSSHGSHLHPASLANHHPAGAAGTPGNANVPGQPGNGVAIKTSPMIRDFVQTVDDREWQASLFGLLQNQTYNQCEVDLFELMCKVLDQNLFSQVDWARNSVFFKDLKVDDQMKLLQHSWSDMLVLDHLHQRLHNNLPDETTLHNGQKFDLLCLGLLGVPSLADLFNNLSSKLQELKFDLSDYICMKFLMLLNHDVRGLVNKKHVQEGHEQVQQALLDYTLTCYPSIPDKFNKLLAVLPEIHVVASRGEDHLYQKHCNGGAPTQTLLMEMLHAKRK